MNDQQILEMQAEIEKETQNAATNYPEDADACHLCGAADIGDGTGETIMIDTDPGDPEVGPQPCFEEAWICEDCSSTRR